MSLTRREALLGGGMAGIVSLGVPSPLFAASPAFPLLTAREGAVRIAPEGYPETAIWGYDATVPGPVIRVKQGARVQRRFRNDLARPTAVHWHGIRIDNAMDGVPGMTQAAVVPGGAFDYDFVVPDAGTYWYHSHNQSQEQVARGLYGPLIVEEPEAPDVDADVILVVDDWRMTQEAQIHESFGQMHDLAHGGRIGNYTQAVLLPAQSALRRHDRLRLRLINPATDRIMVLSLQGLEGWVMALDGMPLAAPEPLGRITLAPAQRVDLFVDVTAEAGGLATLVQHERDGGFALLDLPVTEGSRSRRGAPAPLPPNPGTLPVAEAGKRQEPLLMEGGAMGGLARARHQGEMLSMRDLAAQGQLWAFNGVAGMTPEPWLRLSRGEAVRIEMINDTAFPHAIHLHGHHFREVLAGGGYGPIRDTILVDAAARREVVLRAENPGKWMVHCHMLSHQMAGMMTWFEVA
ncbi:Copper resistance protein A precursor [Pseudoruegeria aquimaris]|uniref:Copper resistance protein A n=1 Tax=Pseudoruegeria aquimaris TaxID=393663 RepID=A0A1Y5S6C2_9RHOB|nr:multicopper oxidase family protein [Pseudoruegeria aquimaris]SLN33535.1 Copper resistance protein A precursor [Pseudoruegeria aquimaris]